MVRIVSIVVSGILGGVAAGLTAWGVISASTAAPNHNPASVQIVDYGQK